MLLAYHRLAWPVTDSLPVTGSLHELLGLHVGLVQVARHACQWPSLVALCRPWCMMEWWMDGAWSFLNSEWSDLRRGEGKGKAAPSLFHCLWGKSKANLTANGTSAVCPAPLLPQLFRMCVPVACHDCAVCGYRLFLFHWLLEWIFNDMLIEKATELTVEQNWSMITSTTLLASTEYNSIFG